MISSLDAVKAINDVRGDAVVVGTMTPNRYWESVTEKPDLDLPIFGGMGKASSVALGIAIAQPDKKVLCLDGDGSLLMNLGTLVTTAGTAPENLVHFVFEDGGYFTTGGSAGARVRERGPGGNGQGRRIRRVLRVQRPRRPGKRTAPHIRAAGAHIRVPEGRPSSDSPALLHGQDGP